MATPKQLKPGDLFQMSNHYPAYKGIPEEIEFSKEKSIRHRRILDTLERFRMPAGILLVCIQVRVHNEKDQNVVFSGAKENTEFYDILLLHPEYGRCLILGRSVEFVEVVGEEE